MAEILNDPVEWAYVNVDVGDGGASFAYDSRVRLASDRPPGRQSPKAGPRESGVECTVP